MHMNQIEEVLGQVSHQMAQQAIPTQKALMVVLNTLKAFEIPMEEGMPLVNKYFQAVQDAS